MKLVAKDHHAALDELEAAVEEVRFMADDIDPRVRADLLDELTDTAVKVVHLFRKLVEALEKEAEA